jgi:hypothetical protein
MIHPLWFCKVRSAQMRSAFVFLVARLCSDNLAARQKMPLGAALATEKAGDCRVGRIIEAARWRWPRCGMTLPGMWSGNV